jgi:hypothetical protein
LRCHLAGGEKRVPLLAARWRLDVRRARGGSSLAARCGDLGDRFGDVRRGLAELAPAAHVALMVRTIASEVWPVRSVIQSASLPANIAAVTKNARMSWARRRSLFSFF